MIPRHPSRVQINSVRSKASRPLQTVWTAFIRPVFPSTFPLVEEEIVLGLYQIKMTTAGKASTCIMFTVRSTSCYRYALTSQSRKKRRKGGEQAQAGRVKEAISRSKIKHEGGEGRGGGGGRMLTFKQKEEKKRKKGGQKKRQKTNNGTNKQKSNNKNPPGAKGVFVVGCCCCCCWVVVWFGWVGLGWVGLGWVVGWFGLVWFHFYWLLYPKSCAQSDCLEILLNTLISTL